MRKSSVISKRCSKNGTFDQPPHLYEIPIVLIQKKYGTWGLCIDNRDLKKITVRNQYPIPKIDEGQVL
jgi:hypothetical protein